jgi:hypothetical protein
MTTMNINDIRNYLKKEYMIKGDIYCQSKTLDYTIFSITDSAIIQYIKKKISMFLKDFYNFLKKINIQEKIRIDLELNNRFYRDPVLYIGIHYNITDEKFGELVNIVRYKDYNDIKGRIVAKNLMNKEYLIEFDEKDYNTLITPLSNKIQSRNKMSSTYHLDIFTKREVKDNINMYREWIPEKNIEIIYEKNDVGENKKNKYETGDYVTFNINYSNKKEDGVIIKYRYVELNDMFYYTIKSDRGFTFMDVIENNIKKKNSIIDDKTGDVSKETKTDKIEDIIINNIVVVQDKLVGIVNYINPMSSFPIRVSFKTPDMNKQDYYQISDVKLLQKDDTLQIIRQENITNVKVREIHNNNNISVLDDKGNMFLITPYLIKKYIPRQDGTINFDNDKKENSKVEKKLYYSIGDVIKYYSHYGVIKTGEIYNYQGLDYSVKSYNDENRTTTYDIVNYNNIIGKVMDNIIVDVEYKYNINDNVTYLDFDKNEIEGIITDRYMGKTTMKITYVIKNKYDKVVYVFEDNVLGLYDTSIIRIGDTVMVTVDGGEKTGVVVDIKDNSYYVLSDKDLKTYKTDSENVTKSDITYTNPFKIDVDDFINGDHVIFKSEHDYELKNGDIIKLKDKRGKIKSTYIKNNLKYALVNIQGVDENIKTPMYVLKIDVSLLIYKKGTIVYITDDLEEGNNIYNLYRKVGVVVDNVKEGELIPVNFPENVGGHDFYGECQMGHCLLIPPSIVSPLMKNEIKKNNYSYVRVGDFVMCKDINKLTEEQWKFIEKNKINKVKSISYIPKTIRLTGSELDFKQDDFITIDIDLNIDKFKPGDIVKYNPVDDGMILTDKNFLLSKPYHEVEKVSTDNRVFIKGLTYTVAPKYLRKHEEKERDITLDISVEEELLNKKFVEENMNETWISKTKLNLCKITSIKQNPKINDMYSVFYNMTNEEDDNKKYYIDSVTKFLYFYRIIDKDVDLNRINNSIYNIDNDKEKQLKKIDMYIGSYKRMGVNDDDLHELKNQKVNDIIKLYRNRYKYLKELKQKIDN